MDLLLIVALSLLLVPVVALTSGGLRIAVVPLIVLALNYTPWGIRLYPILVSVLLFIVVMSVIAWYRRRRLPPEERFEPRLRFSLSSLSRSFIRQGHLDRVISVVLAVAIVGAIGTLGYVVARPKAGERFTQFYVLGPEGMAANYPRQVDLGEKSRVLLGIMNREGQTTEYKVVIAIDGEKVGEVGPITLSHEQKWEQQAAFAPTRAGSNQKVEFLLYKGINTEPYQTLHLWIDVRETR